MKTILSSFLQLKRIDASSLKTILALSFLFLFLTFIFSSFFNYTLHVYVHILMGLLFLANGVVFIAGKKSLAYTLKRLGGFVALVAVMASLTFLLLRLLPGGPFDADRNLPPEVEKNLLAKYNLSAPLYKQYFIFMKNLAQGQLGESYKYLDQNVSDILKKSLPVSVQLGLYSLIFAYLFGIPLGVFAAARRSSVWDKTTMILAISGIALPSFLTAPLVILFFNFRLGWFEAALWEGPSYYVLPVLVLGVRPVSVIARLTRASMLDTLHSDYIRTARAKGLSSHVIFYKHILKNAFIPVLTFSGPLIAALLTGAFVIEQIFAIPGMSRHLVSSVINRDYPLVLGTTLVYCVILIFSNLVVDLLYSYFDPRIRLS